MPILCSAVQDLHFIVFILCLAGLTIGCEENLQPIDSTGVPFSIYGVLSPDLDTQSVRVYLPEIAPTLGSPVKLKADVYSTDLHSGKRRAWRDSVVLDSNGQFGHVFWAPFRPEYGRRYRLEAVRMSDGATSFADVTIPPEVSVRIEEMDAPLLHVFIEGEDFRVLAPEAVYDVSRPIPHPETGRFRPVLRYEVAYDGLVRSAERGWLVTFNMITDAFEINLLYNGEICRGPCGGQCGVDYVYLDGLSIRAIVGDTIWNPPGGVFDSNILSQPGTLSNVENGLGFIGAGYELIEPLNPSPQTVELACFQYGL